MKHKNIELSKSLLITNSGQIDFHHDFQHMTKRKVFDPNKLLMSEIFLLSFKCVVCRKNVCIALFFVAPNPTLKGKKESRIEIAPV